MNNYFNYSRIISKEVKIGALSMGAKHPIRVQSMTNTNTLDVESTVEQSKAIIDNGGELVRITTPSLKEVDSFKQVKTALRAQGYNTPLVADIHYSAKVAEMAAKVADKIRINPGNYGYSRELSKNSYNHELESIRKNIQPLVEICNDHNTAIRIGVNHGSLSERILNKYGNTALGIATSAIEFIEIFESLNFHKLVISLKSSNPKIMVYANRLLLSKMKERGIIYPMHLGVTEAGEGEDGRIKSAIGIGTLLEEGIGNTIRVSLTEPPENEIPVAKQIIERYSGKKEEPLVKSFSLPVEYTGFKKRETIKAGNIGGTHKPIVISSADSYNKGNTNQADFIIEAIQDNPSLLHLESKESFLITEIKDISEDSTSNKALFVKVKSSDIEKISLKKHLFEHKKIVFILEENGVNYVQHARQFFAKLKDLGLSNPVILKNTQLNNPQINNSINIGSLFIDGLGDGIWIDSQANLGQVDEAELSLGILQSAGARISKTEFISCPTCGRTLFDIEKTLKEVKKRTNHLKGLKIAVMGCIVNGPGEMADADYGYVGAGKEKVTLYRNKEVVKRNIPQTEAINELINLIKADGKWQ